MLYMNCLLVTITWVTYTVKLLCELLFISNPYQLEEFYMPAGEHQHCDMIIGGISVISALASG